MPEYFTPQEVAAQLKFDIQTIRRYLREGRFPGSIKIRRSWRIPADDVTEFNQKHQKPHTHQHYCPIL